MAVIALWLAPLTASCYAITVLLLQWYCLTLCMGRVMGTVDDTIDYFVALLFALFIYLHFPSLYEEQLASLKIWLFYASCLICWIFMTLCVNTFLLWALSPLICCLVCLGLIFGFVFYGMYHSVWYLALAVLDFGYCLQSVLHCFSLVVCKEQVVYGVYVVYCVVTLCIVNV